MLVNRVRELQGYTPRIEELRDLLISPISFLGLSRGFDFICLFGNEMICKAYCFDSGPVEDTYPVFNNFALVRSFSDSNPGTLVVVGPSSQIPNLDDRVLDINQWILLMQAFFDEMCAKCTTATVALIQATERTDPVSKEMRDLWFYGDIYEICCFEANLMLDDLRAKRDEWTLEIEGLRRELDHMGDKVLALITDLSLNR